MFLQIKSTVFTYTVCVVEGGFSKGGESLKKITFPLQKVALKLNSDDAIPLVITLSDLASPPSHTGAPRINSKPLNTMDKPS